MKRVLSLGLAAVFALSLVLTAGCGGDSNTKDKDPTTKPGTNLGSKDVGPAKKGTQDKKAGAGTAE